MKMVIDIPEGMLDELRTCKFPIQEAYRLCVVIESGIPLPKGHGRLIDADKLQSRTRLYAPRENEGLLMRYADLQDAPTIIDADKETGE